jgi:hypothetical protein
MNKAVLFFRSSLILSLITGVGLLTFFLFQQMVSSAVAQPQPALATSGDIITDTVWTAAGSPYLITGTVTIMPGAALTIEAGVSVLSAGSGYPLLYVAEGAGLVVQGTAVSPVTFSSQANSGSGDWASLTVAGSAHFDHALFQNSHFNLDIQGETGGPVVIANTVFSQSVYGLNVGVSALHRLHMSDVAFEDVVNGRVLIDIIGSGDTLSDNTALTTHPGLEGYEWGPGTGLWIPAGITLTIEAGVSLLARESSGIVNFGHLQAIGTPQLPVTITAASGIPGDWCCIHAIDSDSSVYLENVTIEKAHFALAIGGAANVSIIQSRLSQSTLYPLFVGVPDLPNLHMENVHFDDNAVNRIMLLTSDTPLDNNATLTAQPGLEGYEWGSDPVLEIPAGITLTVEPGVALMGPENGIVWLNGGHLQAVGTLESPITFTAASGLSGDWDGISIFDDGSAYLEQTVVEKGLFNLGIGPTSGPVSLKQSQFSQSAFAPLIVDVAALHHLQMDEVHFQDNTVNRIMLDTDTASPLSDNATLTAQSGLEGYELWHGGLQPYDLIVPAGVTLTAESGVTLFIPEFNLVLVQGHLQAVGTPQSPVTFTAASGISGDWDGIFIIDDGSAYLEQTVVEKGRFNLGIGPTSGPVSLKQSQFSQSDFVPLIVDVAALHRLQMDEVHFQDNAVNRIMLDTDTASPLSDNATLTAQSGLEGYELWHGGLQPYDLIVPAGVTLTAESGVTLFVPEGDKVQVQGHLQASGTLTHPVTFTGVLTGTAGWGGLYLQGTAVLSHTHVTQSQASGILVDGGDLTAECSTFSHNQSAAIWVTSQGFPQLAVTASNFFSNEQAGLNNENSSQAEARYNWWGDASGPGGIGPGSGDAVWGEVLYEPWLTETAVCPLPDEEEESETVLFLPVVTRP